MIEFRRDKKTGELLVYKDGKYEGKMVTTGDEMMDHKNNGLNDDALTRETNHDPLKARKRRKE